MSTLQQFSSIEDIILSHHGEGRKKSIEGMAQLKSLLPADFCRDAARFLYEIPRLVMVVTGFYEPVPQTVPEPSPQDAGTPGEHDPPS